MLYPYLEWLLNPNMQMVLSALMITLVLLQKYATERLSARLIYSLWWLVPLSIIALNLPSELKPITNNAISYFRVTPQLQQRTAVWQFSATAVYSVITVLLLLMLWWQHYKFSRALNIKAVKNSHFDQPLFVSSQLSTPMVIGLWKPIVVLPSDYDKQFDHETFKLLLEHENTHIHRFDNVANMALILLCIACWFNPIAWLGYQSFRRAQELACDEKVLQQKSTHQQLMYAKALISCAQNAGNSALAYSYYGDKSTMKQRLIHLQKLSGASMGAKCLVIALACGSLSAMALAKPNDVQAHKHEGKPHPVMRIEPKYPAEAANAGISGYVTLQFTIDGRGHTNNIEVIDAQPQAVFEQSAITALRQWQYTSASDTAEHHVVQLDYALGELSESTKTKVQHERIKVAH
ncbi:TonB family protein [Pseudoalteromonas sp. S16_S37]|uniref:TonB family protein n=1 Tax=Pseudoalteromonas sp. S16_S37 TaxID=2720228 RepID=UPI00168181CC|nr:TonB family protein [Pseudoalteromonas sp. S16_S37]MBD1582705.1 TonB family protein [Pseudoalteromonas sp. S16_S37]